MNATQLAHRVSKKLPKTLYVEEFHSFRFNQDLFAVKDALGTIEVFEEREEAEAFVISLGGEIKRT